MIQDPPRTRAALDAYQHAMRRSLTWRNSVRAALAAADAWDQAEREKHRAEGEGKPEGSAECETTNP